MTFLTFLRQPPSIHVPSPAEAARAVVVRLLDWQEVHYQRKRLSDLDDRALKDIGLTRSDVEREINKAFWQL
jgi:uncharacterized protein YjiS (DUF1127 family)